MSEGHTYPIPNWKMPLSNYPIANAPNFRGRCKLPWACFRCRENISYKYDETKGKPEQFLCVNLKKGNMNEFKYFRVLVCCSCIDIYPKLDCASWKRKNWDLKTEIEIYNPLERRASISESMRGKYAEAWYSMLKAGVTEGNEEKCREALWNVAEW